MNAPTAKTYTFVPFGLALSQCTVRYSYSSSDSAKTDLFVSLDGHTFKFDSSVLTYAHLGEYVITVTAENNSDSSKTSSATFVVEVVKQLCENTEFTFHKDVFIDKTYDFPLDPVTYQWPAPLVQTDTAEAQCGPLLVGFFVVQDAAEVQLANSNFSQLLKLDYSVSSLTVSSDNNRGDIGTH